MRHIFLSAILLILFLVHASAQTQTVYDDFEGNGTISGWLGIDCNINTTFANPYPGGINTSATVMEYNDLGGQYANAQFDVSETFDLPSNYVFSLKIYVPSSEITGTQPNQVSLKLQDGTIAEPWSTQCEIIKPIELDQWQTVTFDFLNDDYINFDPNSFPPTQRTDFNRVVIQVNGENNNDFVVAYIDDLFYNYSPGLSGYAVQDDFEGNGTITGWFGDDCNMNTNFANPYPEDINTSATVMEYNDVGGQYANVRFDVSDNFDLLSNYVFGLKIYVSSSGITGTQPNQVSLKLQDGTLAEPWSTQCEIIKPIELDQWETVTFDFLNDDYINLDPNSLPPTQRTDFNRVIIQVNGENNNDQVIAYIDDVYFNGALQTEPEIYDVLVWSDEFDGEGAIDDSKWHHETLLPNPWGWHNGEIQHYTDRTDNAHVSNGNLHIVGKKETYTDQGLTTEYTSARLNSKFAFQYGKVEVRAKLPEGAGTWPAIWTLGKNFNSVGGWWSLQGFGTTVWPDCGEIDIMEHWGSNQNYVQSATHTPSSYGATINQGGQTVPTASSEFHTYQLIWYPEKLVFSVDDIPHFVYEPEELNSDTWPFDAEQYILLNFAVLPEINPDFTEASFEVDYVRVYQTEASYLKDDLHVNNVLVYPNPTNGMITVDFSNPEYKFEKIEIINLCGQIIYSAKIESSESVKTIDLSAYSKGINFIQLKSEDSVVMKKIIIE